MKITGLNTFSEDGKLLVGVTVQVEGTLMEAIGKVVNAIEGNPSPGVAIGINAMASVPNMLLETAPITPAATPRRTRNAAPAATTAPSEAPPAASTEAPPPSTGERRRRTPAAPAETAPATPAGPVVITDADMSKAASNAAAVLTPAVVMSVMQFFDAGDTSNIKPMARQAFIDTLRGAMDAHAIVGQVVGLVADDVTKLRAEDASLDAAGKFLSELAEEIKLAEAEKAATA